MFEVGFETWFDTGFEAGFDMVVFKMVGLR